MNASNDEQPGGGSDTKLEAVSKDLIVRRKLTTRLSALIAAPVLVVIVCAAGGLYKIHARHDNHGGGLSGSQDNQTIANLMKSTARDSSVAQFKQSAAAWRAYAEQTTSPSHKKLAYEYAGADDMSNYNFTEAVSDFKAAAAIQELNYADAYSIAQADMRLNQKTEAIYYLKQSLRLMPSRIDGANAQRALISQDIASLDGT